MLVLQKFSSHPTVRENEPLKKEMDIVDLVLKAADETFRLLDSVTKNWTRDR